MLGCSFEPAYLVDDDHVGEFDLVDHQIADSSLVFWSLHF